MAATTWSVSEACNAAAAASLAAGATTSAVAKGVGKRRKIADATNSQNTPAFLRYRSVHGIHFQFPVADNQKTFFPFAMFSPLAAILQQVFPNNDALFEIWRSTGKQVGYVVLYEVHHGLSR